MVTFTITVPDIWLPYLLSRLLFILSCTIIFLNTFSILQLYLATLYSSVSSSRFLANLSNFSLYFLSIVQFWPYIFGLDGGYLSPFSGSILVNLFSNNLSLKFCYFALLDVTIIRPSYIQGVALGQHFPSSHCLPIAIFHHPMLIPSSKVDFYVSSSQLFFNSVTILIELWGICLCPNLVCAISF